MNNITKITELMVGLVQTKLDEEDITLTSIEQTTRSILHEVGRQTVEATLKTMKPLYPEGMTACACGGKAGYVRQRTGQLLTVFGKLQVKRAYHLCKTCHKGHFPLEEKLGLRPNALSAELSRLAAMTGVQLPFGKGRDLFEELALVSVSDQAMAKATQGIGDIVAEKERKQQKLGRDEAYIRQRRREARRPVRLYGVMDAAKIHIRDDPEHRWRDIKIGAWFEACGQPPISPDGEWSIRAKRIHYYADICPSNEFGKLLWGSGVTHDAQLAHELVMLGDGADWIWNLVDEHFPHAVQILDWFHASEHLMPVAQAVYITEAEQGEWVTRMKQFMWEGRIEEIVTACKTLASVCSNDEIRKAANYFENHKERMRYAYFRKQGYQIGSGTIESAAKQIGLMRMKVPGAIWNEANARKIAKARASYLSDHWHSLPLAV